MQFGGYSNMDQEELGLVVFGNLGFSKKSFENSEAYGTLE